MAHYQFASSAAGAGLVDGSGHYTTIRRLAQVCKWCRLGCLSQTLLDGNGTTHVCTPCPPGSSQPELASGGCEACEPGTYTDNTTEKTECASCPLGRYAVNKGTARCTVCGDPTESDKPAF